MNPVKEFDRFVQSHLSGDTETIKEIVDSITRNENTTIIKCLNCGEIIAFEKTRTLFMYAAGGVPTKVNYRMIKHILEDPEHDIVIPVGPGHRFSLSKPIEKKLRNHCNRGDEHGPVDFDTWFPTYVERWRKKAEDEQE